MFAFLITFFVFLLVNLVERWVKRKARRYSSNEKLIGNKLNEYLDKYKEEYQLNDIEIFRLKVLTLFSKLKDEEEKEKIRKDLKEIVKKNGGKAHIVWGYRFFSIFFRVLSSISLLFFVSSPTNPTLAMMVNFLIISSILLNKSWVLCVLMGIFGFIFYPKLPSHFLFFLALSRVLVFYKKFKKTRDKKSDIQ